MIKVVAPQTKEDFMAFQGYTAKKAFIPLIIAYSALIVLVLVSTIATGKALTGVIAAVVLVLLVVLLFFIFKKNADKQWNTNKTLSDNVRVEFAFGEEDIEVVSYQQDKQTGKTVLDYTSVHKVVDYKNYYFIYLSNVQAYILNKSYIEDDEKEVGGLLLQKLGDKYKVK